MKNADCLDVVAGRDLIRSLAAAKNENCESACTALYSTFRRFHIDRALLGNLSKIAHMEAMSLWQSDGGSKSELKDARPYRTVDHLVVDRAFSPERPALCPLGKSNSRPQSKQTRYVRSLMVNTRLM
jgi:hypothetical protein